MPILDMKVSFKLRHARMVQGCYSQHIVNFPVLVIHATEK